MHNRINLLIAVLLSVMLGACASSGYGYRDSSYRGGYGYQGVCSSCGTVERVEVARYGDGRSSGAGAVAGAIIGGVLGNQVGKGDGRKAATVAGAVAGGVVGNKIEKDRNERATYAIYVRMDDGRRLVFEQKGLNGIHSGDRVRASGRELRPL
ncbi:MAG: glycine zipper 2TM domain-containing protein [Lysobacteraceae bacterium]